MLEKETDLHICKISLICSCNSKNWWNSAIKKAKQMKFGNKFPIYIIGQLNIFELHLLRRNPYEIRTKYLEQE